MKYPLDIEICVKEFIEEEGHKDSATKFMREYVTILNGFYNEGFSNPAATTSDEAFNIKTYEYMLKECPKENFEKFLVQAKDAYNQGLIDAGKEAICINTYTTK